MIFTPTSLKDAFVIDLEPFPDERGFFARSWSASEFAENGLTSSLAECNISFNTKRGTLRGMHYQLAPFAQTKLVRCTRGSIYDVIIDLRGSSPTFKQWTGVELSAENHRMLYVPDGFAHGFQTLEDATEVFYQVSSGYAPEAARGVRWDDPAFGIRWPTQTTVINARDANYEDFSSASFES